MQRSFLSILGITLMIALFIPQIIFAEDYILEEDSDIKGLGIAYPELHILDIGVPNFGGDGCPDPDSYEFKPLENGQLSFYFKKYEAETNNYEYWVSKFCNITLPIKMEEGYRLLDM